MATTQELEMALWKTIEDDRTVMLALKEPDALGAKPMTALIEHPRSPVWFFTAKNTELVRSLGEENREAAVTVTSKGHDLFGRLDGTLVLDTDPAVIDRLWSPFIAAWFEGGKSDPNLALLRFTADHAEVWENENSFLAGAKMLLGVDPKKSYRDKVADIPLR